MPIAEKLVWFRLRGRQLARFKFRRHFGVGPYILDFYCPKLKLGIEIDGDSHSGPEAQAYDVEQQKYVESFGISLIRFSNKQVFDQLDGVTEFLTKHLSKYLEKPPLALP